MEALSSLLHRRRKERAVARCGVFSVLAVLMVTAGFLVGCVHQPPRIMPVFMVKAMIGLGHVLRSSRSVSRCRERSAQR